ncbi:MAG: hypothetical protein FJ395_04980 [Verrucomicrobia bacterium]|nr:hypothetical protein [Verrucomicrobiota bacterium]
MTRSWFSLVVVLVVFGGQIVAADTIRHRWLCVDNGKHQLLCVDQFQPEKSWSRAIPPGSRDIQLVAGNRRVLVSHGNGAAEYDVATGTPTGWAVTRYSGIQSAVRLANGHTLLARGDGAVFDVDARGNESAVIQPQEKFDVRLVTLLDGGNLLFSAAKPQALVEMTRHGAIVKKMPLPGKGYRAVVLSGGRYRSSTGDECKVVELDGNGNVVSFVGGKAEHPALGLDFFSGWDTLPNGNIVVANWLGHAKHGKGCHLVEFSPANKAVWTWQDHELARQITNVKMLR